MNKNNTITNIIHIQDANESKINLKNYTILKQIFYLIFHVTEK